MEEVATPALDCAQTGMFPKRRLTTALHVTQSEEEDADEVEAIAAPAQTAAARPKQMRSENPDYQNQQNDRWAEI